MAPDQEPASGQDSRRPQSQPQPQPQPQPPKEYPGREITVTFDTARCLHAAECVQGLPRVFDVARRPWIAPDGAPPDQVAEVVRRCPSGALRYRYPDGTGEEPDRPTVLSPAPDGRIVVRGDLTVRTTEGDHQETRVTLCGCGATRNPPYCDHTGPCGDR
ncbi:(4Fe-4S)-binding protein [Streptomyces sp. NPDC000594]|uniref:(4Fe-4S)-binding protein n=1 Tax=Streptomyces sp. NPDC000594 TaxID=3154261 RepID=UPI0033300D6D